MYDDEFPTKRTGFRLFGWAISGGMAIFLIVVILTVLGGVFTWLWAPWKGEIEARNNTIGNGQYVVASYDWYFDQCGAIQTSEQKRANYMTQLGVTPPPSPDQQVRLQAAVMAETNAWIELVNKYNANADKEKYKGKFKDDNLPDHIDPNNINNGIETICA